jgi:DNA ligase (NAD+)
MNASRDELLEIDEVGSTIAESIFNFLTDEKNRNVLVRLKNVGLQFEQTEEQRQGGSDKLSGLTFVISGVFNKYSRDQLKDLIELNGGKNSSSISKKTSFVLAGANMGPEKLKKAQSAGVKLLSEEEFERMI